MEALKKLLKKSFKGGCQCKCLLFVVETHHFMNWKNLCGHGRYVAYTLLFDITILPLAPHYILICYVLYVV